MRPVRELLEEAITEFDKAIEAEVNLSVDTDCDDNEGRPYLKVVNHIYQNAYAVYLDTIVSHYKNGILPHLVKALKTGEFVSLNGITRIVGLAA